MSKLSLWELIDFTCKASPRVLLYGPPSTGKTYAGLHARPEGNAKYYAQTFTEDTPTAELRGHYIPHEGKFTWKDGPGTLAWRNGARLVLNELDRGSPEIQSLMYVYLDDMDSAYLTLPTGETIHPAAGFTCVGTMNGYPEDLPDALQSRFPVKIHVDDVHPAALEVIDEDLRELARQLIISSDPARRVDLRTWMEFSRMRALAGPVVAAQACFGARCDEIIDALRLADLDVPSSSEDVLAAFGAS